MEAMFLWMLSEAWPYILGALALIAGLFGFHRVGKQQGEAEAERAQQAAASEQRRKVNEVDTKLVEMDDDDVRRELERWVRPGD